MSRQAIKRLATQFPNLSVIDDFPSGPPGLPETDDPDDTPQRDSSGGTEKEP